MRSGYAEVNGLKMYYELHGPETVADAGTPPLVLLHGGVTTIEVSFGEILPSLAATRPVVAAELQGHGRTADTDREMSVEAHSDDVVALLGHLGIARADFFGFSLGGLVALQTAIRHPERVRRMVLASAHYRPDGYHPEVTDPASQATSELLPTEADFAEMREAYLRTAPDPGHFAAFFEKVGRSVGAFQGWDADALRGIASPTLLVVGDTDFVRLEHAGEMKDLIPGARLAVLPATKHAEVTRRSGLVVPMTEAFLGAP